MSKICTLALALLGLSGCAQTPEKVGDKFVDLYFVEVDQARARPLTSGLAQKKLDDELTLVQGVRREAASDERRPTVFYVRREMRVQGERAHGTYDITVKYGRDETHKNAMVSLARDGETWRVENFTVAEGHLPEGVKRPRPAPGAAAR
jgi:hypothetical protein